MSQLLRKIQRTLNQMIKHVRLTGAVCRKQSPHIYTHSPPLYCQGRNMVLAMGPINTETDDS